MHTYDKSLNGATVSCEVCGCRGEHHQHHVSGRRFDARAIWVCWQCHAKIHANPAWSYKNGYMERRTNLMETKKTRTCKHSTKTQNRWVDGKLVPHCLFCGQPVKEMGFGVKKPVHPITKKKSKGIEFEGFKQEYPPAPKMGFEPLDPRIAEAEKLKKQYVSLKRTVNRNLGTVEELETAKKRMAELKKQMDILEATYHED